MIGWVFPGQGSQKVGMLNEILAASSAAKALFEEASDLVGVDLIALCVDGPDDQLTATENAQPAILTTSIALLRELQHYTDEIPTLVAGHSLGEYSALVAADALSFADAVRCVRRRGELMAQASSGTMAAIIGLELERLEAICMHIQTSHGVCVVANQNAPGQLVISGENDAVAAAGDAAKAAGAKRVMPLNVSAAFHSPLMQEAATGLSDYLENVTIRPATIGVVANSSAQIITDPATIRAELVTQMTAPVRWIRTIQTCVEHGITEIREIGPGSVLTGLSKRIAPEVVRHTTNAPVNTDT